MREGRHYIQCDGGKAIQIHREGGGRQYIQCVGGKLIYKMIHTVYHFSLNISEEVSIVFLSGKV